MRPFWEVSLLPSMYLQPESQLVNSLTALRAVSGYFVNSNWPETNLRIFTAPCLAMPRGATSSRGMVRDSEENERAGTDWKRWPRFLTRSNR